MVPSFAPGLFGFASHDAKRSCGAPVVMALSIAPPTGRMLEPTKMTGAKLTWELRLPVPRPLVSAAARNLRVGWIRMVIFRGAPRQQTTPLIMDWKQPLREAAWISNRVRTLR